MKVSRSSSDDNANRKWRNMLTAKWKIYEFVTHLAKQSWHSDVGNLCGYLSKSRKFVKLLGVVILSFNN